jgi:hypothetical protein
MEDNADLTSERAKARSIEAILRRDRDGEGSVLIPVHRMK